MDPTVTFCPNEHCPARGQTGQGNIGIHSRKEQRFVCHECHQTFSARKGTVFYRLRTSAETVVVSSQFFGVTRLTLTRISLKYLRYILLIYNFTAIY